VTSRQRITYLVIAAVIAVVAVVVIVATSGGDDTETEREAVATPAATEAPGGDGKAQRTPTAEPTPAPAPSIEVKDGEVVGGVEELSFKEGERIRFSVTSDVADEVHVHAYDIMKDVEPGTPVRFDFPATITGITEVELEGAGMQIAELRVEP
jgi:hypothetical protein